MSEEAIESAVGSRRYCVSGTRVELRDQEVRASVPREALTYFKALHPGFSADSVAELDEHGEVVRSWVPAGQCELCGREMFEGEESRDVGVEVNADGDTSPVCSGCAEKWKKEQR